MWRNHLKDVKITKFKDMMLACLFYDQLFLKLITILTREAI